MPQSGLEFPSSNVRFGSQPSFSGSVNYENTPALRFLRSRWLWEMGVGTRRRQFGGSEQPDGALFVWSVT